MTDLRFKQLIDRLYSTNHGCINFVTVCVLNGGGAYYYWCIDISRQGQLGIDERHGRLIFRLLLYGTFLWVQ